jgi:beta-mannanase
MRRYLSILLASAFAVGIQASTSARTPDTNPMLTKQSARGFGAYDPYGNFSDDQSANIEHLFLPWEDVDLASLADAEIYAKERGRSILITIEPWTWSEDWRVSPDELRARIMSGAYDANMSAICQIAGLMEVPVTIRWGHEMEDTTGRFTWANWNPADYIAAYRKMTGLCRADAPNATFMWSPKGDEGLQAYYPGDEYVDVVGLSIFGLQQWDQDKYGGDRTFSQVLQPAYERVAGFNKPVVVAELGTVGNTAYVASWNAESRDAALPQFPQLTSVVYFNQKEVAPWPDGYGLPDWRVTENVIF